MSTVIDHGVWDGVRHRRGPARGIVVVAILLAVLVVGTACVASSRGMTSPGVFSPGSFSQWDASSGTITARLDLGNTSRTDVTVVEARLVAADGSPLPYASVTSFTPVLVPAGTSPSPTDKSGSVTVLMTVHVDCAAALAGDTTAAQLVLATTGTWPRHDVAVGTPALDVCSLPPDDSGA